MHTDVEMTLTVSLLLDEMVNALLNKVEQNENGEETSEPRNIPFRLKYRLTRNKATLDKDYRAFQQKQLMLLAKYGELTSDGEHFEIKDPEKLELYKGNMEAALSTIVTHSVVKLEAEDLENLLAADDLQFTESMLKLLMGYLVEDEAFLKDITTEINWKTYQPKTDPMMVAETVTALNEAAKAEETPKPKKTKSQQRRVNSAKDKPVSDKITEASGTKPASKKTTTKKTAAKKATAKDKANE